MSPATRRLPTWVPRARFAHSWSARIGLALTATVILIAIFGPFFAPHSPSELASGSYAPPSGAYPFGTDLLGRDVLSRVLWGGRSVVGYAVIATALAYLVGGTIGLVSGYSRSLVDPVLMRLVDILLAIPPFLLLLVLATGLGTTPAVLIIGVAAIHVPGIARIVRAATLEVSVRGYVEAAVARGETTSAILRRQILPNITGTVIADGGPRLTISILLVAGLNYLGIGLQPPAADWALMISENRPGLDIQPWSVALPALLIAMLTIGVNVLADAIARSRGVSVDDELIRR